MNLHVIRTIFFKELLDTARDKRTLMAMVGVPVLLYPVIFVIGSQIALLQMEKLDAKSSVVAVAGLYAELPSQWVTSIPKVTLTSVANPQEKLNAGEIDAVVVVEQDPVSAVSEKRTVTVRIEFDGTVPASREAEDRVSEGLEKVNEKMLLERLTAAGLPKEFASPILTDSKDVAPLGKTAGNLMGTMLPLIMVMMLCVGAFYPAIDMTAGEKERGTFETLLSAPISTSEIVWGKFLGVYVLSLATGVLNLASMMLTVSIQFAQLHDKLGEFDVAISATSVLVILLILFPLAFFISAVMMSIAVCARGFREGQNLITPFFVLMMIPASATAFPDLKLSEATQFIPIANVSLLFKQLMIGSAPIDQIFGVMLSTTVYAVLAIVAAIWLFQREEVILSEERGIPFTFRRSQFSPSSAPTVGLAMVILGACLLLAFYVGSYVQSQDLYRGVVITQWGLFFVPTLVILWYVKVDLVSTLNLRAPRLSPVLASVLIAIGWIPLSFQAAVWQTKLLPPPTEFVQAMEQLISGGASSIGVVGMIVVLALSPAICEETLFRGAVLSGLRGRLPGWALILAVSCLFGAAHMSVFRFIPTALSGAVLTYLAYRSRSIYVSMAAHFVINSVSVIIASNVLPSTVQTVCERIDQQGVPIWALAISAAVFCLGIGAMERISTKQ